MGMRTIPTKVTVGTGLVHISGTDRNRGSRPTFHNKVFNNQVKCLLVDVQIMYNLNVCILIYSFNLCYEEVI